MRVLFITPAPLFKAEQTRLARVMGFRREDLLYKHDFLNLLPEPLLVWPTAAAREQAINLLPKLLMRKRVVLLGNQIKDAFRIPHHSLPYFSWQPFKTLDCPLVLGATSLHNLKLAVCPHLVGTSRWWDSESNLDAAMNFFAEPPFGRHKRHERSQQNPGLVSPVPVPKVL